MRTWGRITNEDGSQSWVQVTTTPEGFDDYVWVTTLIQCLKLALNESPFYANYGIPAQQSVIQQVYPDYYVAQTQTQFAPYFANLQVAKIPDTKPFYRINVTTQQGVKMATEIPV